MRKTIGVMGSSEVFSREVMGKARMLGAEIAKRGCILVTGATTGVSYYACKGAKQAGGLVIGISPASNQEEHEKKYSMPTENMDFIVYTGFGLQGRNVLNIKSSDALVFVSGGIGTLNELTIALAEGKPIGILEKTGGVTDMTREIIELTGAKAKGSAIIEDDDPKRLIEKLLRVLKD